MVNYAVSDLHGYLKNYKKIKKILQKDDIVYCLGDCGDRGPEPWKTVKRVYEDPQFIYLKGNHEDMLVKALKERNGSLRNTGRFQKILMRNGGWGTLEELMEEGKEKELEWLEKLDNLPFITVYKNIILCHAGLTWEGEDNFSEELLLWDREHYFDSSATHKDFIVVHGHTPMQYLANSLGDCSNGLEAYRYCDGKKYCIDAWTYRTGNTILFNLDTFESILIN